MVTLEFHDPSGAVEVKRPHAPRLASLAGKHIGFVSTVSPDNFIVIVAGGGHPTNSYWLQGYSPGVVGRVLDPPDAFDDLLAEAERDLGPR
jgi:hypothetical protein